MTALNITDEALTRNVAAALIRAPLTEETAELPEDAAVSKADETVFLTGQPAYAASKLGHLRLSRVRLSRLSRVRCSRPLYFDDTSTREHAARPVHCLGMMLIAATRLGRRHR